MVLQNANPHRLAFLFVEREILVSGPFPVSFQRQAASKDGVLKMKETPRTIIVAGPNGAGKTTFAREFLSGEAACPVFINADLIASGIAPFAPKTASLRTGRLMLQELTRPFATRTSFAFETTLSGRGYLRLIDEWKKTGYRVKLIFLQLASTKEAIARVAQRVKQGNHYIPEEVIRHRFVAGKNNFEQLYAPVVDAWALYDDAGSVPALIDWSERP
jgi:predicted ABC-type ATPase